MKRLNFIPVVLVALVTFVLTACEKNNNSGVNTNSLSDLAGIYYGEFTPVSGGGDVSPGKVEVENTDNADLSVHCLGNGLDTTIIVNAYDDGDSIMVCDTSIDFNDDYHRMQSGSNMMSMANNDETDWMQHMNDAPDSSNIRFGGFDMTNNSFFCDITTADGDSLRFTGSKKQ